MRLEDMLKDISGITNKIVKTNCFEGQNTLLDSILLIQTKVNEVIQAINNGIIKGDKGDTPNVQVGVTETLEPNSAASVTQTGDILNPIFNFGIPKGEKGDKGDTGKASESIQDNVTSLDTTWSSTKIDSLFKNIDDTQGLEYITENNFYSINGSKNGVITNIKLEGKTLVVDSNNNVVIPGTQGAMLKSVGDGVAEIKLNSVNGYKNLININDLDFKIDKYINAQGSLVSSDEFSVSGYIKFVKNQQYIVPSGMYSSSIGVTLYDKNKNFLKTLPLSSPKGIPNVFSVSEGEYIRINLYKNTGYRMYYGNVLKNDLRYIENNKKVLYKDTDGTWKKPTLRQWDSIEKHSDGKYYYHERSNLLILNGSESGYAINSSFTNDNYITITKTINDAVFKGESICNDLPNLAVDGNRETQIFGYQNVLYITCSKSKVGNDLNSFKNWMISNNIKIVYKTTQEQIFECTPLDLISYDTQTNYSIECGPIYPKSILYINSDYGNVLSNIIRRITQIEEDIIEDRKALIRGDFRLLTEKTYPSDFIKKEVLPNE